ncbi:Uncharacterized protein PECH_005994 [Penicillium ucsense]|uniref:Uncharacterized protein n=1 Tax=Penicillium ucsense TaxID=2839758 RepID=A0A8J8W1W1_9EURO|nr:Uncharacterized protein PECM_006485 [Penicillium ucsense]KAF7735958.1 Uncharacterized protein PECH_005994 [Penicillium ucsense]
MFEDFSFSTPSSRPGRLSVDVDDRLMVDCDSSLVSPLSSRCPSPQSHRFRNLSRSRPSYYRSQQQQQQLQHQHQQPPTSVPFPYESKRLSISTLTQKLHEHTLHTSGAGDLADRGQRPLDGPRIPGRYAGYVLTPPDTDHDSDGRGETSPSLCSNPSPTSIPPEFLALDRAETPHSIPELPDHVDVRLQRQQISQLQCNEGDIDAVRRTVVEESSSYHPDLSSDDCHPSSLPPRSSPRRRALTLQRSRFGPADAPTTEARGGRRRSNSCAMQSHRIEKNHHPCHPWRDMSKRGDHHGLRRMSMVSAALASVVERP